jgi:hypothetical protein
MSRFWRPNALLLKWLYFGSQITFFIYTVQCEPSIFEKVFIWFLGQPVVWSEPNISQIEAWSYSIYAWYQEFEFEFFLIFFKFQTKKFKKFYSKMSKKNAQLKMNC